MSTTQHGRRMTRTAPCLSVYTPSSCSRGLEGRNGTRPLRPFPFRARHRHPPTAPISTGLVLAVGLIVTPARSVASGSHFARSGGSVPTCSRAWSLAARPLPASRLCRLPEKFLAQNRPLRVSPFTHVVYPFVVRGEEHEHEGQGDHEHEHVPFFSASRPTHSPIFPSPPPHLLNPRSSLSRPPTYPRIRAFAFLLVLPSVSISAPSPSPLPLVLVLALASFSSPSSRRRIPVLPSHSFADLPFPSSASRVLRARARLRALLTHVTVPPFTLPPTYSRIPGSAHSHSPSSRLSSSPSPLKASSLPYSPDSFFTGFLLGDLDAHTLCCISRRLRAASPEMILHHLASSCSPVASPPATRPPTYLPRTYLYLFHLYPRRTCILSIDETRISLAPVLCTV
ncbi:hypothetical protein DFH06DRAFT_1416902 [Mycena polygramma]|nr:hypothetical protein DFH06DRAFT_1416902 [Mycena polygramma]